MYSCRICFDDESVRDKIIVPCKCNGSSKYVHKECLNMWLSTNKNNQNYERCNSCLVEYLREKDNKYEIQKKADEIYNNIIYSIVLISLFLILIIWSVSYLIPGFGIFIIAIITMMIYFLLIFSGFGIFFIMVFYVCMLTFQSYKPEKSKEKSIALLIVFMMGSTLLLSPYIYDESLKIAKGVCRQDANNMMYDYELNRYVNGVF